MEKVIKKTLGYSKPKPNEDFTHVIYTQDEYNKNISDMHDLRQEVKRLEKDYDNRLAHYKNSADDKIAEIREQADGRIAEARADRDKHRRIAQDYENANANLIRIATERANAQRGLSPKKQHIGYIFLSMEQYTYNCECDVSGKNKITILKLPCVRVRLQSPYQVGFNLQAVKNFKSEDFTKKNIYEMLGLEQQDFNIKNLNDNELINIWNTKDENFVFKTVYKANFQKGFWEIELLTRFMVHTPPEMIKS
jgi:ElaB/YqjD/DUF883 family membrane-anchored ribosome-binding protein